MKKDELLELAVWGMRRKLRDMEVQLADWWKEFPGLFLGDGPPTFLRPEPRGASSNGHWPPLVATKLDQDATATREERSKRQRASWTPERRAKQALAMKRMIRKKRQVTHRAQVGGRAATTPKVATAKIPKVTAKPQVKLDLATYQQMHDYLTLHPGARLGAIATAIDAKHPANASSRLKVGLKRGFFEKKKGVYYAATTPSEAQA